MASENRAPAWWGAPERMMDDAVTSIWQTMAWYTGAPITSITLKKKDECWLLVVHARSASRGALVVFIDGRTPGECFGELLAAASKKGGLDWKADKWNS